MRNCVLYGLYVVITKITRIVTSPTDHHNYSVSQIHSDMSREKNLVKSLPTHDSFKFCHMHFELPNCVLLYMYKVLVTCKIWFHTLIVTRTIKMCVTCAANSSMTPSWLLPKGAMSLCYYTSKMYVWMV